MDTYISIGVGVIIVGLISYVASFYMTPGKCKIAHKEIIDDIKIEFINHREQMKEWMDIMIENKILKELRQMNDKKYRDE